MRIPILAFAILGGVLLAGCNQQPEASSPVRQGRYIGIGVFSVGALWSKQQVAGPPAGSKIATIADDEHVIVVVDSYSGEIRQCGDYSGHCVSMNPWTKAISDKAPVELTKHAADLATEAAAEADRVDAKTRPAK